MDAVDNKVDEAIVSPFASFDPSARRDFIALDSIFYFCVCTFTLLDFNGFKLNFDDN